jgi:hypothetical protein
MYIPEGKITCAMSVIMQQVIKATLTDMFLDYIPIITPFQEAIARLKLERNGQEIQERDLDSWKDLPRLFQVSTTTVMKQLHLFLNQGLVMFPMIV